MSCQRSAVSHKLGSVGNDTNGVRMEGTENCTIIGNLIGTDDSGFSSLANKGEGVYISSGKKNRIGGDAPEMRNTISGNGRNGILISGNSTTNNRVIGNLLGLCMDGSSMIPNGMNGIRIENGAHDNQIGGGAAGEENFIAGNKGRGVEIGRGVIDIPRFLKTLVKIGYRGMASFEYEKDADDPLPGLAESVGYVRGVLATI